MPLKRAYHQKYRNYLNCEEDSLLQLLLGPTLITKALFIVAVGLTGALFVFSAFTVLYHRFIYTRSVVRRYKGPYTPRCTIVLPCKGIPKNLDRNLNAFLSQDYPNYEFIFTVENENDPAYAIIKAAIANKPQAKIVVAGLATTCCQKNKNMLAALEIATNPEVYVFADADIGPTASWLKDLVLPLSDPKTTIATGFRWLMPEKGTLAELVHFYMNAFLYILYSPTSYMGQVHAWGGSMAIRKADFERCGIAKRWAETAVDDSSMCEEVLKHKGTSVLVPLCITQTNDLIQTVGGAITWFERQMMYLKLYQTPIWIGTVPVILFGMAMQLWLPIALILSFTMHISFWDIGGGAALSFYICKFAGDMLFPLIGKTPRWFLFYCTQPVLLWCFLVACFRTIFTNTITWSGVKYRCKLNGVVTSVRR